MPWNDSSTNTSPNWSVLSAVERRERNEVDFQIVVANLAEWFVRADRAVTITHFIQEP